MHITSLTGRKNAAMPLSHIFIAPSSGLEHPEILKKIIKNHKIFGPLTPYRLKALDRFKALRESFKENPQYIWSVRGGYGMTEMVYLLEKNKVRPPQDSIYVGYSDATILHLWLRRHQKTSVHGIMPYFCQEAYAALHHKKSNSKTAFSLDPFSQPRLTFKVLHNPHCTKKETGPIMGGNLGCVHSQLGTPTELQGHGEIVFLEEVGETLAYQKRLLRALIAARTFEGARGIFLGNTGRTKELANFLHEKLPNMWIIQSDRLGHADYNDFLPLGYQATFDLEKESVTFDFSQKCLYQPRRFKRETRVLTGLIDITELLSLNGQYHVTVKGVLTLPYTEMGVRFMRHIVNAIRAGNFSTYMIKVKKHVLSEDDKKWCEKELWDIAKMKIEWVT